LGGYALREANQLNKLPGKQRTAVGLGVAGVGKLIHWFFREIFFCL
jgi:uncharacterized protein YjeT (DUF2065 family)